MLYNLSMNTYGGIKEKIFEREKSFFSSYAAFSEKTKGRTRKETPCPMRTEFQRDRDRIIYSKAFIRLKNKTQVFFSPEGDHYMTRLTHTLDVSQIARSIARGLSLNEDLAEAIALGHDLGHTPFGHAGERVLDKLSPKGFRHNEQSLRVVEYLEKNGEGLNLTFEVKDGILNHKLSGNPATLEGKAVSLADRIAYLNHDVDDAVRAGIISINDLPREVTEILGKTSRERINVMISSIISSSDGKNDVTLSESVAPAMKTLRSFMFDNVYLTPYAKAQEEKAGNMLSSLYAYIENHTEILPEPYHKLLDKFDADTVICDYISGMTDRYAISVFAKIFIPDNF